MQPLFSEKFSQNRLIELFTIYKLSDNLYQAKSDKQIVVLWKMENSWEGVTNHSESVLIEEIGNAIDRYLQARPV